MSNIFKAAKGVRRKHPSYTWKKCVQMAAKQARPKKRKSVKRRAAKKKRSPKRSRSRVGAIPSAAFATGVLGSVSHHTHAACAILKDQLGKKLISRELATTKTKRKKITREIAKIKKKIHAIKS